MAEVSGLRFQRTGIRVIAVVVATLSGLAWWSHGARAAGSEGVATMIQLSGEVAFRNANGPWYAAYPELRHRLLDHVRTGAGSVATLEFDVGGRIGLNDDSEIQIVGERGVEEVGKTGFRRLILRAGGVWARVTRQTDELQVQTSGGVMGVKGTEFVVETAEDGPTTLSVFEGTVEVRPVQGDPLLAGAGTRVTFDPATVPVVKTYEDPEQLRREVMDGWGTFNAAAGPLMSATGTGAVSYYGGMALDVVMDPGKAARDFAASQVSARVPLGGLFGGAISSAGRNSNQKPDFPTGLGTGPDGARRRAPRVQLGAAREGGRVRGYTQSGRGRAGPRLDGQGHRDLGRLSRERLSTPTGPLFLATDRGG